jgi:transposase
MAGQESGKALAVLWGLQAFAIRCVEIREAPTRTDPGRRIKVISLEDLRSSHVCSECGKRHRQGYIQELEPRMWRECSIGDFETYIEIMPWRVLCCGGTRVESFPWEASGHRMTRRFFERIAALCTALPVLKVAKMVGLSWDTVARVDKAATRMALGGDDALLDGLRFIGVDEVSRDGGHRYFTMVSDLETGRVVWIAEGKRKKALEAFFVKLGNRGCKRLQIVTSDLGAGYVEVIGQYAQHARHILDRFHIVKWANEAIKQIRRRVFGGAPRDEVGRKLKAKQWMLLRAREKLERKHKLALAELMRVNRPLYRAYLLKEQLRGILHHPWVYLGALHRNLEGWCSSAVRSRIPELRDLGWRLRRHLEKVVAGFETGIKKGVVEANNGKVDLLRREARGYRNTEYFKLKIFQRCSLPDNPWAEITL